MTRVPVGARTFPYPMPTVLIGSLWEGRPDYSAVSYCGFIQHEPPMLAVSLNRAHATAKGIAAQRTFSVNIPGTKLLEATDYCGIASGSVVDKSAFFDNYYGILGTAPMIGQCPISLECRLLQVIDFGGVNDLFIGAVAETFADPVVLADGIPQMDRIDPILFSLDEKTYWNLGRRIGTAWSAGRNFPAKKKD